MSIYVKVRHHKAEGFITYTTFIFNTIVFCYKLSRFAFIFLTPVYRQDIDKSANTIMFLSFRTDSSGQTVQTQIRAVWSGSTLFAIPSASFGLITLW